MGLGSLTLEPYLESKFIFIPPTTLSSNSEYPEYAPWFVKMSVSVSALGEEALLDPFSQDFELDSLFDI